MCLFITHRVYSADGSGFTCSVLCAHVVIMNSAITHLLAVIVWSLDRATSMG